MAPNKQCVYCGATSDLTKEHAPPQSVFPKPRPNNLITVNACGACNWAGSQDAEYFRLCLCFNTRTKNSESAKRVKPAVHRSLNRSPAKTFRDHFLSGVAFDSGRFSFHVDTSRILSVIQRTVQCLYYYETGQRIPESHTVSALNDDFLAQFGEDNVRRFQDDFVRPLSALTPNTIGGDAFAYASIHTTKEFTSVWGLVFYGNIPFVALTGRTPAVRKGKAKA